MGALTGPIAGIVAAADITVRFGEIAKPFAWRVGAIDGMLAMVHAVDPLP